MTVLAALRRDMFDAGEIAAPSDLDAIARNYTAVVQGMSIQARDGATRADLGAVIAVRDGGLGHARDRKGADPWTVKNAPGRCRSGEPSFVVLV